MVFNLARMHYLSVYTWTLHLKTWRQFVKNVSLFWCCKGVFAKKRKKNLKTLKRNAMEILTCTKGIDFLSLFDCYNCYRKMWLILLAYEWRSFFFFFEKKYCLLGVTDDRGKFIYISPEELEAVAKFIKQRGRVTISELAESSSTLVNLQTDQTQTHTPSTAQVSA